MFWMLSAVSIIFLLVNLWQCFVGLHQDKCFECFFAYILKILAVKLWSCFVGLSFECCCLYHKDFCTEMLMICCRLTPSWRSSQWWSPVWKRGPGFWVWWKWPWAGSQRRYTWYFSLWMWWSLLPPQSYKNILNDEIAMVVVRV